jgi:hypothetical protein
MTERWEYLVLVRLRDADNSSITRTRIFHPGSDPDGEARETDTFSEVLNEFGSQGWELVTADVIGSSAFPASTVQDFTEGKPYKAARSYAQDRSLIFKRRIQQ